MKSIYISCFFSLIFFVFISCRTQSNLLKSENKSLSTITLLKSKQWQAIDKQSNDVPITIIFNDEKEIYSININPEGKEPTVNKVEVLYYLSDNVEAHFDSLKVGTVENGKYLIEKLGPSINVFEIQKVDSVNLIVVNLKNSNVLKYRAISKDK